MFVRFEGYGRLADHEADKIVCVWGATVEGLVCDFENMLFFFSFLFFPLGSYCSSISSEELGSVARSSAMNELTGSR